MDSIPQFTRSMLQGEFAWVGAIISARNFYGEGAIFRGVIFLGDNCLGGIFLGESFTGGNFPGDNFPRRQLSSGANFQGAIIR